MHNILEAFARTDAFVQGVRSGAQSSEHLLDALESICTALDRFLADDDLWTQIKGISVAGLEPEQVEQNLDVLLELEIRSFEEEGLPTDVARRLASDLGLALTRTGVGPTGMAVAINEVKATAGEFKDIVCTSANDIREATAAGEHARMPPQRRFRLLRVAISGVRVLGGAATIYIDAVHVAPVDVPSAGVSIIGGADMIMTAIADLRRELG